VCLIVVTVFWRGMSPATAGPASSAEMTMLASILKLLMMLASWQVRIGGVCQLVARGDKLWYTEEEGATQEICIYRIFDDFQRTMEEE
jgi:hypothetical protein